MADSRLATPKTITVLILGKTGTGKSTFINSAANYLIYPTLEEALKKTPVCVIPTKFLHNIRNSEKNETTEIIIEMGGINKSDVENEFGQAGQSSTKSPRVYSFVQEDIRINFIDVPGIADTGGVLVDSKNKAGIIEKIQKFDKIHAVWIFLTAKESRATCEFLYCLKDIFSLVPKTAIENVAFIITNSRSDDYTAGNTTVPLNVFIDDLNENCNLQIDKSKSKYCVDSEAFKFLIGSYSNPIFKKTVAKNREQYEESWRVSKETFFRLLKAAFAATAQPTKTFVTISHARIVISCFLGAAVKILHLIEKSSSPEFLQEYKSNLKSGVQLQNECEISKNKNPQTVCTVCMKWKFENGKKFPEFTPCHDDCYVKNIIFGKMPQKALKNCIIFDLKGNCQKCPKKCSYKFHTHLFYNIQNIIKCKKTTPKTDLEIENDVKIYLENLSDCKTKIMNAIKIAYIYLYQNSIFIFNDSFEEKIKIEIRVQEANEKADKKVVENLKKVLEEHKKMLEKLEPIRQKLKNVQIRTVTEKEFENILEKIFQLPFYGLQLKKIYESERDSANLSTIDFTPIPVNHILTNVL